MTSLRALFLMLLSMAFVAFTPLAQAAGNAEQEARAAFVKLVAAAKTNNVAEFKKLIAAPDLKEMEAMEKEQAGFITMFMSFVAEGGDPKEYTAEVTDKQVKFVKRVTEKSESGSGTQTTTVRMIRDGGEWKFGKPRN